ncbi:hypothetical protein ACFVX6_34230 [Streptomyces sp. NPDC058289]|uniref:ALF repeat-containing protein n=1 Tax=Streptomyces sp. NPDC058289 TaxID=3346425 RepID=UPI0036E55492
MARTRDQEQATVAELAKRAEEAGAQADLATKAAIETSEQAKEAARRAQEAAARAAKETEAARNDSLRAAAAAGQAASAARGAAQAAQKAIAASNAAIRAARIAATAAQQAAGAAIGAADAAAKAGRAAADAATDKNKAAESRQAAQEARDAARAADGAAKAAESAAKAAEDTEKVSTAARGAAKSAQDAADAAEEADGFASAAGVNAAETREAAAQARRHANEANRAATTSETLARKAAKAAYEARDFAKSAATHARKAADEADRAADHAGEAAQAAAESTKHAKAAQTYADVAAAAVTKAKEIHDLGRETEQTDIDTRTAAATERAKDYAKDAQQLQKTFQESLDAVSARKKQAEELGLEAAKPGADLPQLVLKGRKLALDLMQSGGAWTQSAATDALTGTDQDVRTYLLTGRQQGLDQDARDRVEEISKDEKRVAKVRTAAAAALKTDTKGINEFLKNGQYKAEEMDLDLKVNQISSTGGANVKAAARKAMLEGTGQALAAFINEGQYTAREVDENLAATQLASAGGPELKAAAEIALYGDAQSLHEFITTGQYSAQRRDNLTATHSTRVTGMISSAARVAALAQERAFLAAKVAAEANDAAHQAKDAEAKAKASATKAAGYAEDAKKSAAQAQTSATKAAQSAKTARAASDRAQKAAADADISAAMASQSHQNALASATEAHESADQAYADAKQAGQEEEDAIKARDEAFDITLQKAKAEYEAALKAEEQQLKDEAAKERSQYMRCEQPIANSMSGARCYFDEQAKQRNDMIAEALMKDPAQRFIIKMWAEGLALSDLAGCADNPEVKKCGAAAVAFLPVGKVFKGTKFAGKFEEFVRAATSKGGKFADCFTRAMPTCPVGFVKIGTDKFRSPSGIKYKPGSAQGHRIDHLMEHTKPNATGKPLHTIFIEKDQAKLLNLVDRAYKKRGLSYPGDQSRYYVDLGEQIGEGKGENWMRLVVNQNGDFVTAYPVTGYGK